MLAHSTKNFGHFHCFRPKLLKNREEINIYFKEQGIKCISKDFL